MLSGTQKRLHKMNIPTILHESNAVPGLTTKMLSGIVNEMLVAIPSAKSENYKRYVKHQRLSAPRSERTVRRNNEEKRPKNL